MVKTLLITMYRDLRIFNFVSLVPRGGITCTNFAEGNFGRLPCIPNGAAKKGSYFGNLFRNQLE